MPSELLEHQHELTTEDESLSLVFGTEATGYLTTTYPAIGNGDDTIGDTSRFREDGDAFGEDYLGGKTVTFEIVVLTDNEEDPHGAGAEALAEFEGIWKKRTLRDRSGKYAILRSMVGGKLRRAYGRPRRYEEQTGSLTRKGIANLVCDFKVQDGRWYDDALSVATISIAAASDGGIITPVVTPVTTIASTSETSAMTVGGKTETWPVVTFHGPVTNPRVNIGDAMTVALNDTLASGQSVTVDPRPWVRSVRRNDGASKGGKLTYDTPPLRRMLLEPGTYELTYEGIDLSGSSWASVEWRDAYSRW